MLGHALQILALISQVVFPTCGIQIFTKKQLLWWRLHLARRYYSCIVFRMSNFIAFTKAFKVVLSSQVAVLRFSDHFIVALQAVRTGWLSVKNRLSNIVPQSLFAFTHAWPINEILLPVLNLLHWLSANSLIEGLHLCITVVD